MDPQFESYFTNRAEAVLAHGIGSAEPMEASASWRWSGSRNQELAVEESEDAEAAALVRAAVDNVCEWSSSRGHSLRGDAQILLYLSFRELVTRPLAVVRGMDAESLTGPVQRDIALIAVRAGELSGGPEVSSHQVVNAVSQLWGQLETATLGIWD